MAAEAPAKAVEHPFNLHIHVPHLQAPHMESDHSQLNLSPPGSPGIPGPPVNPGIPGPPVNFNPTPPAQHGGLHLNVPSVHVSPYIDLTPFPHPDPPSGERNPGNAELGTDHSLPPEDLASDPFAQAQIATSIWAFGTYVLGLHPAHGQKGDAEAAPHPPHPPSPHGPHPPQASPTHPGTTDHVPFGLHLSIPQLHIDQPGGQPEAAGAVERDAASSFNLHLLPPGAELHHPGATAAADRPEHRGPDVHLDPTFEHAPATQFNLQLDPSAGPPGQSTHGSDLQLHPTGADGSDRSPGANPFNLHLDVSLANQPGAQGPSEHLGGADATVQGSQAEHRDQAKDNQAPPVDQAHTGEAAHVADGTHMADVGQGENG